LQPLTIQPFSTTIELYLFTLVFCSPVTLIVHPSLPIFFLLYLLPHTYYFYYLNFNSYTILVF
jgi:hypothetical protein